MKWRYTLRPDARVSRLAPVPEGPAARELSELALDLIGLTEYGLDRDDTERRWWTYCADGNRKWLMPNGSPPTPSEETKPRVTH